MVPLLAHLDGVRHGVEDGDGPLIGAVRRVGVALAPDGRVVGPGHGHDLRPFLRQIKLLILLLEIEGHDHPSLYMGIQMPLS